MWRRDISGRPETPGTQPAVLETAVDGVRNACRSGDGRYRTRDRRRPVQIRVRYGYRDRQGPEGPVGGHRPFHLGQEGRAGVDAGVAARSLPALADHDRADLGARFTIPRSTSRTIYYYSAPKSTKVRRALDEVDPELLATYEKLGMPLREQASPGRRRGRAGRGRCGVRLRSRWSPPSARS